MVSSARRSYPQEHWQEHSTFGGDPLNPTTQPLKKPIPVTGLFIWQPMMAGGGAIGPAPQLTPLRIIPFTPPFYIRGYFRKFLL